jgi:hypothetical protein
VIKLRRRSAFWFHTAELSAERSLAELTRTALLLLGEEFLGASPHELTEAHVYRNGFTRLRSDLTREDILTDQQVRSLRTGDEVEVTLLGDMKGSRWYAEERNQRQHQKPQQ